MPFRCNKMRRTDFQNSDMLSTLDLKVCSIMSFLWPVDFSLQKFFLLGCINSLSCPATDERKSKG